MHACMYVCTYVCMSVRMHVCMYVCMYVCKKKKNTLFTIIRNILERRTMLQGACKTVTYCYFFWVSSSYPCKYTLMMHMMVAAFKMMCDMVLFMSCQHAEEQSAGSKCTTDKRIRLVRFHWVSLIGRWSCERKRRASLLGDVNSSLSPSVLEVHARTSRQKKRCTIKLACDDAQHQWSCPRMVIGQMGQGWRTHRVANTSKTSAASTSRFSSWELPVVHRCLLMPPSKVRPFRCWA